MNRLSRRARLIRTWAPKKPVALIATLFLFVAGVRAEAAEVHDGDTGYIANNSIWFTDEPDLAVWKRVRQTFAPKDVKMLVTGHEALPNYVRLCLTMTGKTIAARRDDAINFVAAELDALKFAVSHRDETIKLTKETINAKPDDPRPAYAFDDTIRQKAIDPEASLPLDKLNWLQSELVRAGNMKAPIDLGKIVDAEIRTEAMKRTAK